MQMAEDAGNGDGTDDDDGGGYGGIGYVHNIGDEDEADGDFRDTVMPVAVVDGDGDSSDGGDGDSGGDDGGYGDIGDVGNRW